MLILIFGSSAFWLWVNGFFENILLVILLLFSVAYIFRYKLENSLLRIFALFLSCFSLFLILLGLYQVFEFDLKFEGSLQDGVFSRELTEYVVYSFVYLLPTLLTFYYSLSVKTFFQFPDRYLED